MLLLLNMLAFWILLSRNIRNFRFLNFFRSGFLRKNIRNFFGQKLWGLRPESALGSPHIYYSYSNSNANTNGYKWAKFKSEGVFLTDKTTFLINFVVFKDLILHGEKFSHSVLLVYPDGIIKRFAINFSWSKLETDFMSFCQRFLFLNLTKQWNIEKGNI